MRGTTEDPDDGTQRMLRPMHLGGEIELPEMASKANNATLFDCPTSGKKYCKVQIARFHRMTFTPYPFSAFS